MAKFLSEFRIIGTAATLAAIRGKWKVEVHSERLRRRGGGVILGIGQRERAWEKLEVGGECEKRRKTVYNGIETPPPLLRTRDYLARLSRCCCLL